MNGWGLALPPDLTPHHGLPDQVVRLGKARVTRAGLDDVVAACVSLARLGGAAQFVVTPNIQHIALLERDVVFAGAYDRAWLQLPDGWPVARAVSWLAGERVPRLAGSDLLPRLVDAAAQEDLSVGVVGGRPGSAEAAVAAWRMVHPSLRVPVIACPTFSPDGASSDVDLLLSILDSEPVDFLLLALGTPKSEKLLAAAMDRLTCRVAFSVGAAIDFEAGAVYRAPKLMRATGTEWLYRLVQEPRRLAGRYAKSVGPFAAVTFRERRRVHDSPISQAKVRE